MNFWKRTQTIGVASLIVGVSVLVSRFMGLIRDKVISYWFGASIESDLYFAAFVIPDFINYLLAGAYFSITLIPILGKLFQEDESDGWNFFSAALFWVFSAIAALTLAGEIFIDKIIFLTAPGFSPEAIVRLKTFVRIILPAQIFFLTGSCFSAILYLRKQFLVPSLSPIVYNGLIIVTGLVLRSRGIEGFCWGVLIGSFAGNFMLPLMAVKYGGGISLRFRLWHRKMKTFVITALPLMLGQSIVVLDEQLVRVFGSLAGTGAVSHINYARRLMMVPVGIVGQAAAVASYPFMSELFAGKKFDEFFATIRNAIKNSLFIIVLISCAMASAAEPIVGLIFQQGRFGYTDTIETARLLRIYLLAVPLWAFQQILGRAFYATGDTLSPVVIGTITTAVMLPVFFMGANHLGSYGVVGASVSGFMVYSLILAWWWTRRHKGGKTFDGLLQPVVKYCLAGIFPVILVEWLKKKLIVFPVFHERSLQTYFGLGLISGISFLVIWFALASILFRENLAELIQRVSKKASTKKGRS